MAAERRRGAAVLVFGQDPFTDASLRAGSVLATGWVPRSEVGMGAQAAGYLVKVICSAWGRG